MILRNTLAAAVIAVGALVTAAPANAGGNFSFSIQAGHPGYWYEYPERHRRELSPREVRRILRHEGFREIRFIDRRGSVYRARAENRRGRDVIVTVSARSGAILEVERVRRRG